ncbi:MAG TPA: RagB/SusD family nutrient uptake outer membrane protein, partial [Arachidicoccus sp.]|nr:RagB/SusD family nutrient uptake outer membrane protein [Arachidicoccus sp.]
MKNKILIGMSLLVVLFFSACEKLDYVPADQLSDNTFWKTEAQAKQAVVGLYQAMKQPWCFGREFTFDMISDIADGSSPWEDISRGVSFSSSSAGVQNHFQALYELIHRSNTVIRNVAKMDIGAASIDQITGEAKFLRAFAYFRLLNAWGGVPYYDETTDINEDYAKVTNPKSTAEEIRAHIIADLTESINKLPVKWGSSDYGRATKGAAYALRGKVYLFQKQWAKAIADFEEIVYNKSEDYGYALNDSYEDLFRLYNGKHSKEMIFSIQSIDGNVAGYALDIVSYFGNKATMRLIASNLIVPSTTLVDLYQNKDGSAFHWDDVYPGFNNGTSAFRRDKLSVAIDQGSTVITSTLNADTAKIRKVYTERDPRLEWNVITPYSHYLGTNAASVPKDKQFVLADASKGGAPMEAFAFMRNSEGWNS